MDRNALKDKVVKLQRMVSVHEKQVKDLSNDLKVANNKLADIDKPKLTSEQFENLHCAIEQGVDEFDFDNSDNYEVELSLYDNTIEIENLNFNEKSELTDMVVSRVESLFGVADEERIESEDSDGK